MRPLRFRKTKVSELIWIGAVGDTGVSGRRSEGENVVGGHEGNYRLLILRVGC